jgi:hypothetical protein
MEIVTGFSLRTSDQATWKLVDALFQRRNKLAHRGIVPTDDEAIEGVQAASAALRWLAAPEAGPVATPMVWEIGEVRYTPAGASESVPLEEWHSAP